MVSAVANSVCEHQWFQCSSKWGWMFFHTIQYTVYTECGKYAGREYEARSTYYIQCNTRKNCTLGKEHLVNAGTGTEQAAHTEYLGHRDCVTRFFRLVFISQSTPSGPIRGTLGGFHISTNFRGVIATYNWLPGGASGGELRLPVM